MIDSVFHWLEARGAARQGLQLMQAAADAFDGLDDGAAVAVHVHATVRVGIFADRLGDVAMAESRLRRGLAAARTLDDEGELVFALQKLGANRVAAGHYEDAQRLLDEARGISTDPRDEGWSLLHLGNLARARGEYDDATRLHEHALARFRESSDRAGMWSALNNLGVIAAARQEPEVARHRFQEALELQLEQGNSRSAAVLLHNIGCAAAETRDYDAARANLTRGLAISGEMGYQRTRVLSLVALADLELRLDRLDDADDALQQALNAAVAVRNPAVALQALWMLARLRERQNRIDEAMHLARLVASHPAGDEDARQQARALLATEVAPKPDGPSETPPLDDVLMAVTSQPQQGWHA